MLHPVGYSHFATLRKKLHWNETVPDDDPSDAVSCSRIQRRTHAPSLSIRDFVIVADARPRVRQRLHRAHGRDRRRQVDPHRRARASRSARAPTRAWCARAQRAPTSRPSSRRTNAARDRWLRNDRALAARRSGARVMLRRVVDRSGRSRAFINGTPGDARAAARGRRNAGRHSRPACASVADAPGRAARTVRHARRPAPSSCGRRRARTREWRDLQRALDEHGAGRRERNWSASASRGS